jgi:hypothetical protein
MPHPVEFSTADQNQTIACSLPQGTCLSQHHFRPAVSFILECPHYAGLFKRASVGHYPASMGATPYFAALYPVHTSIRFDDNLQKY